MEAFDISMPLRPGMIIYPGDAPLRIERSHSIARGDAYNLTRLQLGAHAGTHVDAPLHFIEGAADVTALPLGALIGDAQVIDATAVTTDIDAATLQRLDIPPYARRLLFKTPNSLLWDRPDFSTDFIGITADAARLLVSKGMELVGMDYLSIAPNSDPASTHRVFLEAGVVVLEGIDLRHVHPGEYELVCLPLRIPGSDGAPARAVLLRDR
jgi:arylformamidase